MRKRYPPQLLSALSVFWNSYNGLCCFWARLIETGRAGSSKYATKRSAPPPNVSAASCHFLGKRARLKFLAGSEETEWMIRQLQRDWTEAQALAATPPTFNEARPKIALAVRAIYPDLPIVDAVRITNSAIDRAIGGDRTELLRLMSDFAEILRAQEEARCSPQSSRS